MKCEMREIGRQSINVRVNNMTLILNEKFIFQHLFDIFIKQNRIVCSGEQKIKSHEIQKETRSALENLILEFYECQV